MKRPSPAASRRAAPPRPGRSIVALLLAVALVLAAAPLTGCVELSRTEKSRYGNPLQSHSSGPRNQFDAEGYQPPNRQPARKPFYRRLFDW